MNFNVFSLFNISSLLWDYLNNFQISPSSNSGSEVQQTIDDGAETLDTDYSAQVHPGQQLNFSILADVCCLVKDTVILWFDSIGSILEFTEFQLLLCKTFLVILFVNLVLIGFYWRKYGAIITDRFIRPSTAKEIEELKLSVARLKLPKEHSPRI